jgi:hypothetical protein
LAYEDEDRELVSDRDDEVLSDEDRELVSDRDDDRDDEVLSDEDRELVSDRDDEVLSEDEDFAHLNLYV